MASITKQKLYVVPGIWTKFTDILDSLGSSLNPEAIYSIQNKTLIKIDLVESSAKPEESWSGGVSVVDFDYKSTGLDLYMRSSVKWEDSQFLEMAASRVSIINDK